MGIMLAGVGLVPVDVNLLIHNLSATGMAIVFLGLLVSAPRVLQRDAADVLPRHVGLPRRADPVDRALRLAFFGLTAFEIIVFALVFAWIAVFIRFLGLAAQQADDGLSHAGLPPSARRGAICDSPERALASRVVTVVPTACRPCRGTAASEAVRIGRPAGVICCHRSA